MKNNCNKKQTGKEQVDFISEILQYSNIIFHKGTELQRNEVLDLLFDIMEKTEGNRKQAGNVIEFPIKT